MKHIRTKLNKPIFDNLLCASKNVMIKHFRINLKKYINVNLPQNILIKKVPESNYAKKILIKKVSDVNNKKNSLVKKKFPKLNNSFFLLNYKKFNNGLFNIKTRHIFNHPGYKKGRALGTLIGLIVLFIVIFDIPLTFELIIFVSLILYYSIMAIYF